MTGSLGAETAVASRADQWRARIAEQQRSGLSVRRFCKERQIAEHSFYAWRRRLREQGSVRFALVERGPAQPDAQASLELVLVTGERLRIGAGADAATIRTVLQAVRA
jgi:transposase-like protein